MYIQDIIFYNRAPFENLHLKFKAPGVSILTGVNGRGKTTILSYIVDSFYEMARPTFPNSFKNREDKLYRISSSFYTLNAEEPSLVYIRYRDHNNHFDYIDVRGNLDKSKYNEIINFEDKIDYKYIKDSVDNDGFARYLSKSLDNKTIKRFFQSQIFTYFPSYRYEMPNYIGPTYVSKINNSLKFSYELQNPITVVSDLESLSSWLLDITLDRYVYKDFNKEEEALWNNINTILRLALSGKRAEGIIRLGIGRRNGGNRVSVVRDFDNQIFTVAPNLRDLSSGESSVLSVFGEIVRQGDNLRACLPLTDIEGIVLIDEIDKNLHIKLQKETLPKLLFAFPKVQFIVTSHSPFLNMGLSDDQYKDRSTIFDLDNNGLSVEPLNCDIYEEVYRMFTKNNEGLVKELEAVRQQLKDIQKPLIITEGETDIQFINKAKDVLGLCIDYEVIDHDKQPQGDSQLITLLKQLSMIYQDHKIIGIFDNDVDSTVKELKPDDGKLYKSYGNNVYGFCIPVPQNRKDRGQNKISIEYYFSDDEIMTILPNGCRLFFGTEFTGHSLMHNTDSNLVLNIPGEKGKDKIIENTGKQAVYDREEKNHLAKKSEFANAVCTDKISISQESWNNFKTIFDIIGKILLS